MRTLCAWIYVCFSSPVNLSVSISLVIHLRELKRRMFPPPWQLVSQPGDWPDCHPKTATAENPGTHNKDQLVAQRVKNLPKRQETWVQFLGWEDILGEEMATLSSILAWRIPWTEEPGYSLWDHEESDTLSNSHTHTPRSLPTRSGWGESGGSSLSLFCLDLQEVLEPVPYDIEPPPFGKWVFLLYIDSFLPDGHCFPLSLSVVSFVRRKKNYRPEHMHRTRKSAVQAILEVFPPELLGLRWNYTLRRMESIQSVC